MLRSNECLRRMSSTLRKVKRRETITSWSIIFDDQSFGSIAVRSILRRWMTRHSRDDGGADDRGADDPYPSGWPYRMTPKVMTAERMTNGVGCSYRKCS
jgi:hypothetical protein